MVASRAACLNHTQDTTHRSLGAYFDNSERPAGGDLCIYCDVGFGFRLSPPFQCVPDPWGVVATWVAGKALVRRDNLRELHKAMTAALAKSESGSIRP
jgi:hypothetical protein